MTTIAGEQHVVRIIKRAQFLVSPDGSPDLINPYAFQMRDTESTLSLNWLDFFVDTKIGQLKSIRDTTTIKLRKSYGLATLTVSDFLACCAASGDSVRILHEPDGTNRSHAAAHRYPREQLKLFNDLAALADKDCVLVGNL